MSKKGRFGDYGGQYVPEIVMPALNELEEAYLKYRDDAAFQAEYRSYLKEYAGRPTNLYFAERLTKHYGKADIYLKRSVRHSSHTAWARSASSQRRAQDSTVSRRRRWRHSLGWNAASSWGHWT